MIQNGFELLLLKPLLRFPPLPLQPLPALAMISGPGSLVVCFTYMSQVKACPISWGSAAWYTVI